MNEVLAMLKLAYEAFASVLRQFVFSWETLELLYKDLIFQPSHKTGDLTKSTCVS